MGPTPPPGPWISDLYREMHARFFCLFGESGSEAPWGRGLCKPVSKLHVGTREKGAYTEDVQVVTLYIY